MWQYWRPRFRFGRKRIRLSRRRSKAWGSTNKVGKSIDLNLEFTNEKGYQQPLKDFFKEGRPVLLNLVYYNCPMLCNLLLNGQVEVLRKIPWTPGDKYEVVTVTINPDGDV